MRVLDFLSTPSVIVVSFLLFLILYFVFLDVEGSFTSDFLLFGPAKSEEHITYFMGIKLDSWTKVLILYVISFLTGTLTSLYDLSVGSAIHMNVYNSEIKQINQTAFSTYFIMMVDPLIREALVIIGLFTSLTLQFQFILPGVIGRYLVHAPFILNVLSTKQFVP
jgi:hypothetical protein